MIPDHIIGLVQYCTKPSTYLQGSHTFSKMKFQDFSRTYQGQNFIFQALSNRYLVYCKRVFLWWNNLPYTKLQYSPLKTWITRWVVTGDLMTKLPNPLNLLKSNIQHAKHTHKQVRFVGPLFFKPIKSNFQALFKKNCQFSRQIEKSSSFQDCSQIQALFKVCGNHDLWVSAKRT